VINLSCISSGYTYFQALEGRLAGGKEVCVAKQTGWQPNALKEIVYLDRHAMLCPAKYYMKGFKMTRRGAKDIRYEYQCCIIQY